MSRMATNEYIGAKRRVYAEGNASPRCAAAAKHRDFSVCSVSTAQAANISSRASSDSEPSFAASGYLDGQRLKPLIDESLELTRMMGASVATARRKLEQESDKEV